MVDNFKSIDTYMDSLDSELVIRKRELTSLKEIIDSSEDFFTKFILLRNTLPTIYAHYEGFLKFSFNRLIDVMKEENLEKSNPNFLAFFLLSNLENHLTKQSAKSKVIRETLKTYYCNKNNKKLSIDKYVINHETLKETCALLEINPDDLSEFDIKENIPMTELGVLYTKRNSIAHGDLKTSNQFSFSSKKDITEAQVNAVYKSWKEDYNRVLKCLDTLKTLFVSYLLKLKSDV